MCVEGRTDKRAGERRGRGGDEDGMGRAASGWICMSVGLGWVARGSGLVSVCLLACACFVSLPKGRGSAAAVGVCFVRRAES